MQESNLRSRLVDESPTQAIARRFGPRRDVIFPTALRRCIAGGIDLALCVIFWPLAGYVVAGLQQYEIFNTSFYVRTACLGFLLHWIYFTGFECSEWQATIGKQCMGIRVADPYGKALGFERASMRFLLRAVNLVTLGVGMTSLFCTKRCQTVHDLMCNTVVISAKALPGQARVGHRRANGLDTLGVVVAMIGAAIAVFYIALPSWQAFSELAAVRNGLASSRPIIENASASMLHGRSSFIKDNAGVDALYLANARDSASVSNAPNGDLIITLHELPLENSRIRLTPRIQSTYGVPTVRWHCWSDHVPDWTLPASLCESNPNPQPVSQASEQAVSMPQQPAMPSVTQKRLAARVDASLQAGRRDKQDGN